MSERAEARGARAQKGQRSAVRARFGPRGAAKRQWVSAGLDLAALVSLLLLPWLYFWRLFARNPADLMTIREGDFTQEYFPLALTAVAALREGALPLWNPLSNAGQPLLADPQNALLYPPTWLALLEIADFSGESLQWFERLIPWHFGLAGVFAYLLGRYTTGSRLGALVTALVFTYSGFLTAYPVQQLPILRAAVWLPLILLCLLLALQRRQLGWSLLGGMALGAAILAGHPQTALYQVLALAGAALVWGFHRWRNRATSVEIARGFAALGLLLLVGLGLSAGQWLPTLEFYELSNRAQVEYSFLAGGFTLWELPLDLFAPHVLGGLPAYVGILPLVLAGLALALGRSSFHLLATALLVVGLVLSLGGHSFVYAALYNLVPGFGLFRNQERAIYLFALGMALLAGSGAAQIERVLENAARRKLRSGLRVLGYALALAVAMGAALNAGLVFVELSGQGAQRWREAVHWFNLGVLLLAASLVLLWVRASALRGRILFAPLAVALIAFDLLSVSWEVNLEGRKPDEVFQASEIVNTLRASLGPLRAADEGVLNGNHGLVYGIPTITQSFALRLQRYTEALERVPRDTFHALLGVGYIVTREARPEDGELVLSERWGGVTNFLVRRAAPPTAYVASRSLVVNDPEAALQAVAHVQLASVGQVVLEIPGEMLPEGQGGLVLGHRRGWNVAKVEAEAPKGGYLVTSDLFFPGWVAQVDGAEAPILRANYLLRAVWLPPGRHEVTFQYTPLSFYVGVGVSVASLVAVGLLAFWLALRGGRRQVEGRRPRARGLPDTVNGV